eukprot:6173705-Pleurochrysis_carterae.AAC.1
MSVWCGCVLCECVSALECMRVCVRECVRAPAPLRRWEGLDGAHGLTRAEDSLHSKYDERCPSAPKSRTKLQNEETPKKGLCPVDCGEARSSKSAGIRSRSYSKRTPKTTKSQEKDSGSSMIRNWG